MNVKHKPLRDQTVVITGASSGIGLATARLAAERGARVVLASRNEDALRRVVDDIRAGGGEAVHVVADVGRREDVQHIARAAIERFGGFDTWVNNAGVSIYGRVEDVSLEDAQRLFDTNFWGEVHGSLTALEHLRERGGAIINVGSIVSERAMPLIGMYSASKHAIKGFTDALRMELEKDGVPVSVTLIKPASIDTPLTHHAKNDMDAEPTVPPPVYEPRVVAEAILACAERPRRDVVVGGGGRMVTGVGHASPRTADRYMEAAMFRQQQRDPQSRPPHPESLYRPHEGGAERGDYRGHVAGSSAYTRSVLHPWWTGLVAATAALGAWAVWKAMRPPRSRQPDRVAARPAEGIVPETRWPPDAPRIAHATAPW